MIRALLVGVVVLLVATFPATWLLMLFLGTTHLHLSYWGTLPLGILVSALIGGVTSTGQWMAAPESSGYGTDSTLRSSNGTTRG